LKKNEHKKISFNALFFIILSLFIVININILHPIGDEGGETGFGDCSTLLYKPSFALGIGILIAAMIIAILLMISRLLESRNLKARINVETGNMINSVIISMIILITLYALCVYCVTNITGGDTMYHFVIGRLNEIEQQALSKAQDLTRTGLSNQFESIYYGFVGTPFTPSGGAGKAYRAYYQALSSHKDIVTDILLVQYITAKTYTLIFMFMQDIGFGMLLPFAIILRLFPIVRPVGNYLLAFVFAFGVILPFVFALNLSFTSPASVPQYTDPFIGNYTQIAEIVAQMLFFPNVAIAIAATVFLAVGRGLDSASI